MLNLVPTPKKSEIYDENYHSIIPQIHTSVSEWNVYLKPYADMFERINNCRLDICEGSIELYKDTNLKKASYRIESGEKLSVYASDDEGILYALSSLMQLIIIKDEKACIQKFTIEDYPDKDYRAFMADISTLWHPFRQLLCFVDICFLYKIKYLHLHFIDNTIYTLPSKLYPKLSTEGEHYTFEEIAYLNEYAKNKGVVLVPEYECPGHALPFNLKYPEIFEDALDKDESGEYCNELGEPINNKSIICAGSQKAWEATKAILKEICDMFPYSPYINIGGDEAKIQMWNDCKVCREYMEKNGIEDEYDLYSEYIGRVASYVLTLNKTPLVWEGFPKKGSHRVPKETIVIAWESYYHLPQDLLEEGFKVINSSWQPLYIVPDIRRRWGTREILKWNVYNWQNWFGKSPAYLNPINVTPTDNVLGGLLCSWGHTYEQEFWFVSENLSAMSERVWNEVRVCDDDEFISKQAKLIYLATLATREK